MVEGFLADEGERVVHAADHRVDGGQVHPIALARREIGDLVGVAGLIGTEDEQVGARAAGQDVRGGSAGQLIGEGAPDEGVGELEPVATIPALAPEASTFSKPDT